MARDIELKDKEDEKIKGDPDEKPDNDEKALEMERKKLEGYTLEQLRDYNLELRDQSTRRRVQLREQEKKTSEKEKELEKTKAALKEAQETLDGVKKKEEDAKKAEMAEVERLKIEIKERQEEIEKLRKETLESDRKIVELTRKQAESAMVNQALAILNKADFKFRSKAEERGFKAEILERDKNGKYKTDSEIESFTESFLKENAPPAEPDEEKRRGDVPPAPGGPKKRQIAPSDQERLRELLNKEDLTKEEINELTELENRIDASLPPSRPA